MRVAIDGIDCVVAGLGESGAIDTTVKSVLLGSQEHPLSAVLNRSEVGRPTPLSIHSDLVGDLTISGLQVEFDVL